jgi:DNA-binding IclR family transcriptional regulator
MLRISSDIGWSRPLHYGMLGMILMAHLKTEDIDRILKHQPLESHTPHSVTDYDAFSLRLEKIRVQGYVVEKEEAVEGAIGMAAPVRDYTRQVVAAVGIALPVGAVHLNKALKRLVGRVKSAGESISSDLGYLRI